MIVQNQIIKGRGAQINPASRFDNFIYDKNPMVNLEEDEKLETEYIDVFPKTMLNNS